MLIKHNAFIILFSCHISILLGQDSIAFKQPISNEKDLIKNQFISSKMKIARPLFISSVYMSKINGIEQTTIKNSIKDNVDIYGISFRIGIDYIKNTSVAENRRFPISISFSFNQPEFAKAQNIRVKNNSVKQIPKSISPLDSISGYGLNKNLTLKDSLKGFDRNQQLKTKSLNIATIDTFSTSKINFHENLNDSIIYEDKDSISNTSKLIKREMVEGTNLDIKGEKPNFQIINIFKAVRKLDIGKSTLTYSELTFNNFLLNGFQTQLIKKRIFLACSVGQNAEVVNSNSSKSFSSSRKSNVFMLRVGPGDLQENHIHLTYFSILSDYPKDQWFNSTNVRSSKVIAIDTRYKISKTSNVQFELAKIIAPESNSENMSSLTVEQQLAWKLICAKELPGLKSSLGLTYLETGDSYSHPGNPFLIKNQRTISAKVTNNYFTKLNFTSEIGWSDFNKNRSVDYSISEMRNIFNISYSLTSSIIFQGIYSISAFTQKGLNDQSYFSTTNSLYGINSLFMNQVGKVDITTIIDVSFYTNKFSDHEQFNFIDQMYHVMINENIHLGGSNEIRFNAELNLNKNLSFKKSFQYAMLLSDNFQLFKFIYLEPGIGYSVHDNISESIKFCGNLLMNLKKIKVSGGVSSTNPINGSLATNRTLFVNGEVRVQF